MLIPPAPVVTEPAYPLARLSKPVADTRVLARIHRQYALNHLAAEMRMLAARNQGQAVTHLFLEYAGKNVRSRTIAHLYCFGEAWKFRLARCDANRPMPQSTAETEWLALVSAQRVCFGIPDGATLEGDTAVNGFAINLYWTEIEQLQLL